MRCVLRFQSILRLLRGCVALAALAVSLTAFGDGLPAGYQSYADRPDVLRITPQTHASLSQGASNWSAMRRAHAEAVAQMLELYPNQDLYFLARDSELLYDAARLIARNDPALLRRLHLLNISRTNMRDPHLMEYLAQEGITPERLRSGHRPIFVDTGFSGTIPRVIGEGFPAELRPFLQTHLLSSANSSHPSSRVFLQELSPAARNTVPGAMRGTVVSYEHMPRYTHRSDRFVRVNGRWQAVSPASGAGLETDGVVSQATANQYQADLAHYIESREGRDLIQRRRSQWRQWRTLLASGRSNDLQRSLRVTAASGQWGESAVRDFVEWSRTNGTHAAVRSSAPLASVQLGLRRELSPDGSMSNKNELIALHPQWAPVLENPSTQIAHLLDHGGTAQLGAILDVIQDSEFHNIAFTQLGSRLERSEVRQLLRALIEKENLDLLEQIVQRIFVGYRDSPHCPPLIQAVIDTGNQTLMECLVSAFGSGRYASHPELLRNLIQNGDQEVLRALVHVYSVLGSPRGAQPDFVRMLVARAEPATLEVLATQVTYLHADPSRMSEVIDLLIETGDQQALRELARFSLPQNSDLAQLRKIIERGDESTLVAVVKRLLNPDLPGHSELFSLLLQRGGPQVLKQIIDTYGLPRVLSGHPELFRQLWGRLDAQQQASLLGMVFSDTVYPIDLPREFTDIIAQRLMTSPLLPSERELLSNLRYSDLQRPALLEVFGDPSSRAACSTQAINATAHELRAEVGH